MLQLKTNKYYEEFHQSVHTNVCYSLYYTNRTLNSIVQNTESEHLHLNLKNFHLPT